MNKVAESEAYRGGVGQPDMSHMRAMLNRTIAKPTVDLNPRVAGSFRSLANNSQYPQARLAEYGMAGSDLCRMCGVLPGTLAHRAWSCGATLPWRRQYHSGGELSAAKESTFKSLPLAEKAIVPTLAHLMQPARTDVVMNVKTPCGEVSSQASFSRMDLARFQLAECVIAQALEQS
jgi:hypothetical protein